MTAHDNACPKCGHLPPERMARVMCTRRHRIPELDRLRESLSQESADALREYTTPGDRLKWPRFVIACAISLYLWLVVAGAVWPNKLP